MRVLVGRHVNNVGVSGYAPVGAHVFSRDPQLWYATIEVDKGSDDGVHINDPVIGDGGLVGKVSTVMPTERMAFL